MARQEYKDYKQNVANFFEKEGITNLSTVSEEGNCEPFFSWSSCECCGTHLGGDRYECNGYNPETKEIQEYSSICQDCVYYAEYSQLDDETMSHLEDKK